MAITKLLLNGVQYDIGSVYNIITEGPELYDGRELEEFSWADLKDKCASADYSGLRVGDYKTITLTDGEVVQMQIAGIDTYYGCHVGGPVIPHHIDFISKTVVGGTVQWNTTRTNNGNTSEAYPYRVSNIKKFLNNTIYPKIPSDVKLVIKNKITLLESRYNSSGTLTDSNSWGWMDVGAVWIPSEYEVFGAVIGGSKYWSQGQATQYSLFSNSNLHKIKKDKNGALSNWWLSTVGSGGNGTALTCSLGGMCYYCYADEGGICTVIAFRIAPD